MKSSIATHLLYSPLKVSHKNRRARCIAAAALVLSAALGHAIPISLTSGTSGSYMAGQSYNETRAVNVSVLDPDNLLVQSMTLSGIGGSGPAEAVIYDDVTHALIASADGTVSGGTVTVPISATLISGDAYSIGFYGHLGTATVFLPSSFGYTDSTGLLQITGASESPTNAFPSNWNLADPQITMQVSQVPETGSSITTLAIGMFAVWGFRRGLYKPSKVA